MTECMVVVVGTMAGQLNDQETEVELRIHSYERIITVITLDFQTKQQ